MYKPFLQVALLLILAVAIQAQTDDKPIKASWDKLQNIGFVDKYVAEVKQTMLFPRFPSSVQFLRDKIVTINGYTVPFDKTGARVALSANPYASCYFCGKASAASVMTIKLKKPTMKYRIDEVVVFKGRLRLNDSNFREYYYVLDDAEEVKQ